MFTFSCVTALCCAALNLYHECRNCTVLEQLAVHYVVENRVSSPDYPDNTCAVIYEPRQFSWTEDARSDVPYEKGAWDHAQLLARLFRVSKLQDPTNGALCYHTHGVKGWRCAPHSKELEHHVFHYR